MIQFLLIYDVARGELVDEPCEFRDADEAAAAYSELEKEHRHDANLEFVLVGAESLETIRSTHGSYFDSKRAGSRFFEYVSYEPGGPTPAGAGLSAR